MKNYALLFTLLVSASLAADNYPKASSMAPVYIDAAHKSTYDYPSVFRGRYPELKTTNIRILNQRGVGYKDDAYKGGPAVDQAPRGIDASQRNTIEALSGTSAVILGW